MVYRDRKTSDGTRKQLEFRWDTDGRLREVKAGCASVVGATYTADGERVTKTEQVAGPYPDTTATGTRVYSFGLYEFVSSPSGGGTTTHTPGFAQNKNGVERHVHTDWLGSTRYLTDSAGSSVPHAARYDGFGLRSALGGTDGSHPTDYQFAGEWGYEREAAAGVGLDYLYQRHYDPAIGRFISRDPIGWAGGLNLYAYVGNSPANYVDPTGLAWTDWKIWPWNWGKPTPPPHPTVDPWGRPLTPSKPIYWHEADQYHPKGHYDVEIKVGGGRREYRYYPKPCGGWDIVEKGMETGDGRDSSHARRMRRLEAGRQKAAKYAARGGRLPANFGDPRPGTRTGGANPGRARPLGPGSGGGAGGVVTVGVGLGVGAQAVTETIRYKKGIEAELNRDPYGSD